ncbi:hypothetical protein NDU88_003766 [Pleurodeles waltl]|uniref:Uncharacterized protein n=1 Tax=Pleurodeles waltl TaxID=8319 RepID=A0AAV7T763_PLEWA|nr:hypothetical protein NDU88_003766 [Pleurodeles waltl]
MYLISGVAGRACAYSQHGVLSICRRRTWSVLINNRWGPPPPQAPPNQLRCLGGCPPLPLELRGPATTGATKMGSSRAWALWLISHCRRGVPTVSGTLGSLKDVIGSRSSLGACASGDSGCTREETRGSLVGARGRRCRAAPGPAHTAVRGEERAEPDLVGRPGRPEIRRRTGGATDSIGRGPVDLVRERTGPRDGGPGGLGGLHPWGLGGPFWAVACDGDLTAEVTAEQRGRPAAGLGGVPTWLERALVGGIIARHCTPQGRRRRRRPSRLGERAGRQKCESAA